MVVSLPMRDGNLFKKSNKPDWEVVVSLPMRDGNLEKAGIEEAKLELLAYL